VAGLATDIHVGPGGGVSIGRQVEVLAQIGRVAERALVVPGLVASGPMQGIAGSDRLAGVEREPALPTLLLRAGIPGDAERLIAAAGEADQVLLQGRDTECVGDRVGVQRAVRSLRPHLERVAGAGEGGVGAVMVEAAAVEVAQHGLRGRRLPGERVVGATPNRGLSRMAAGAGRGTDIGWGVVGARRLGGRKHRGAQGGGRGDCRRALDEGHRYRIGHDARALKPGAGAQAPCKSPKLSSVPPSVKPGLWIAARRSHSGLRSKAPVHSAQ